MSAQAPERCDVCSGPLEYTSSASILAKYAVRYFRCAECCFLRTEKPYWLPEAYSTAIAATDTGIVLRNIKIARQLTCVLPQLFGANARFLDVAGGTGLLTRLMRDNGFDFYWEDAYCDNVLAFGFDARLHSGDFDAVTAFEAVEHMEQPYEFFKSCVERSVSRTFIFTTELFEPPTPPPNWWYYSRATGQHISFFAKPTLQRIAQRLDVRFMSHRGLHLFTQLPLSEDAFRNALDQEEQGLVEQITRARVGFTMIDHISMTKQVLLARGLPEADLERFLPDIPAPSLSAPTAASASDQERSSWLKRTMRRWKRSVQKRMAAR